jgi:rare lipoprotein A
MHQKFFIIFIIIYLIAFQSITLFAQKLILGATKQGICSFYSDKFEGLSTSSGERYSSKAYTGAHRSLPFNTIVAVINLKTNKYVIVRINDRGPHRKTRLIDISKSAALELGIVKMGLAKVEIRILGFDNFQSLNPIDPESMEADSLNN